MNSSFGEGFGTLDSKTRAKMVKGSRERQRRRREETEDVEKGKEGFRDTAVCQPEPSMANWTEFSACAISIHKRRRT